MTGVGRERLAEMIAEEKWQAFFAIRAHFDLHSESVMDGIVLNLGCRAKNVTSEEEWRALGWVLRAGEKGFEIEGKKYYLEHQMMAQEGAKAIWWPRLVRPHGEARQEDIEGLQELLKREGWEVNLGVQNKNIKDAGIRFSTRVIDVASGMGSLDVLARLAHEAGHALMHTAEWEAGDVLMHTHAEWKAGRKIWGARGASQKREIEAEAFAWGLLSAWGYDISDFAGAYICTWSQGVPDLELVFGERVETALAYLEHELPAADRVLEV
jgi:hypothetical protein